MAAAILKLRSRKHVVAAGCIVYALVEAGSHALAARRLAGSASQASMRDALSVYSSFNTGTGVSASSPTQTPGSGAASASATINLGKVFATGVAAQFLSYGQYSL
jgi:hypothetical protein